MSRPAVWQPANDVEHRMRDAMAADDVPGYVRALGSGPLYLPGFEAEPDGRQRLLTRARDGRTYVLVFTSVEALTDAVGLVTTDWRPTTLVDLAAAWPDPAWGLLVSPNTSIGAYLEPEHLSQIAELVSPERAMPNADERERMMRSAQQAGNPAAYLDLLVTSDVLVPVEAPAGPGDLAAPDFPWLVTTVDDQPAVPVFTSAARLREGLPGEPGSVPVAFVAVLRAWPDPRYRLAVNPGSAIDATFTGAQVPDLLRWAQEVAARLWRAAHEDTPAGGAVAEQPGATQRAGMPRALEVALGPDESDRYLTGGANTVSGVVRPIGGAGTFVGHLIRWYGEESVVSDGGEVRDHPLPHGAQLIRVSAAGETVLGSYDADLRRWQRAIADVLRGQ
jgi:SseB protein N-terminal domain